jgi:hypothetical protein
MESFVSESLVEKANTKYSPLESPDRNYPVEGQSSPRHSFYEAHQEPKANEDHHMDVLEEWVEVLNYISVSIVT